MPQDQYADDMPEVTEHGDDNPRFSFSSGPASYDDYVNQAWCREHRQRIVLILIITVPLIFFCLHVISNPSDYNREAWLDPTNSVPKSLSIRFASVACLPFSWFGVFFFPLLDICVLMFFSCKVRMWSWHNYLLTRMYRRAPYLYGLIFEEKEKRFNQAAFYSDHFEVRSEADSKSYHYHLVYKVIRGNGMFILRVKQPGAKSPRDILLDETTMEGGSPKDFTAFLDSMLGLGVKRLDRKMTMQERRAWRRYPVDKDYWDKVFMGKERQ